MQGTAQMLMLYQAFRSVSDNHVKSSALDYAGGTQSLQLLVNSIEQQLKLARSSALGISRCGRDERNFFGWP